MEESVRSKGSKARTRLTSKEQLKILRGGGSSESIPAAMEVRKYWTLEYFILDPFLFFFS